MGPMLTAWHCRAQLAFSRKHQKGRTGTGALCLKASHVTVVKWPGEEAVNIMLPATLFIMIG